MSDAESIRAMGMAHLAKLRAKHNGAALAREKGSVSREFADIDDSLDRLERGMPTLKGATFKDQALIDKAADCIAYLRKQVRRLRSRIGG